MDSLQDGWVLFFLVFDYWFRHSSMYTQDEQDDMERQFTKGLALHSFFRRAGKVWLNPDIIAGVRHQHRCGCCYAFAACDVVSSRVAIKTGRRHNKLAPQCIVNRATRTGKDGTVYKVGCGPGNGELAYKFARDDGFVAEHRCPYLGQPGTCTHDDAPVTRIGSFGSRKNPTFEEIKRQIRINGPVCAQIQVYESFINHSGEGIYEEDEFETMFPENSTGKHRLVVIGYSRDGEKPYLIVKNSWGREWGFHGYAKVDPALLSHCWAPII